MTRTSFPRMVLLVAVACWGIGAAATQAADFSEIKAKGTLRIIVGSLEQPEMFSLQPDPDPGFEREMIEGFARLHRLKTAVVPTSTNNLIPFLLRGEGDVVVALVATEARKKLIAFSIEVIPARHLVVTCAPHPVITTVEDFRSAKVGSIKGSSWATATVEAGIPDARITYFTEGTDLLDALASGKITATVMSVTDYFLAAKRRPKLQSGVFVGTPISAAWGVRNEDSELRAALDSYITHMRKGPSWNRLLIKYFGDQAPRLLHGLGAR